MPKPKLVAIAFWSSRFINGSTAEQSFSREICSEKDLREAVEGFKGPPNLIHFIEDIPSVPNKTKHWLNDPDLLKSKVLLEGRDWGRRGEDKEMGFDDIFLLLPKEAT